MDENVMNYEEDLIEISISDLVITVLKKWPVIVVCAVVFAVLLGGLKGLKSMSGSAALNEKAQETYEGELEDYQQQLDFYKFNMEAKEAVLTTYNDSVRLLKKELERLKTIPEDDDVARLACLTNINYLRGVMDGANNTLRAYVNGSLVEPEEPEDLKDGAPGSFHFSKKFALLGFVFGGFVACLAFALIYVFDGTVKTAGVLSRNFGVRLLGAPDKTALVAANVRNFIPENVKKVLITGSRSDASVAAVADAVGNRLPDVELQFGECLNRDAATAAMLSDVDAVILVEKAKASKLDSIAEEIQMVRNAGRKLIGVAI